MQHIRQTEWLGGNQADGWFNSYYDEHKKRVEGYYPTGVRMMLTGQVFAIMSGTANPEQVRQITCNADCYLYDAAVGGYRLNTDFHEKKMDLGRMFGFAYGEKENGAVFSHMTIMYANALYQRGFVKEGYKALQALTEAAMNFETSCIYPGIPEYFNGQGRGMYHYLTGAASWYMLTVITQVFGVRGEAGDLMIEPKLVVNQFDRQGEASVETVFAGVKIRVSVLNREMLDYGEYKVTDCTLDGKHICPIEEENVIIKRAFLEQKVRNQEETCSIVITLGRKDTDNEN